MLFESVFQNSYQLKFKNEFLLMLPLSSLQEKVLRNIDFYINKMLLIKLKEI